MKHKPQMISDQFMRPSSLNLLTSLSSEQDLGGWFAYCFHMICKDAMTNVLQDEMQYAKLVPREEGKFWGVTAAPIQSTVNLSIWIASAFRWSGWRVIEYQEQTNNLHSDGKIINNACQNRQRNNLERKIRLVRRKSAWSPKQQRRPGYQNKW